MQEFTEKLISSLACPNCKGSLVLGGKDFINCENCETSFELLDGNILSLMPSNPKKLPPAYFEQEYIEIKKKHSELQKHDNDSDRLSAVIFSFYHAWHKSVLLKIRKPEQLVVDLGCGVGTFYKHLPTSFHSQTVGLDSDLEALKKCRKTFPEVYLIQCNLCHLPFKDGTDHHYISLSTFEHIYFLSDLMDELSRVLGDDSLLQINLPTEGGWAWGLGRRMTTQREWENMGINYRDFVKLEHCQTAKKIINELQNRFVSVQKNYFPFFFPSINLNVFFNGVFKKKPVKASSHVVLPN